jgi:hypothetical protein
VGIEFTIALKRELYLLSKRAAAIETELLNPARSTLKCSSYIAFDKSKKRRITTPVSKVIKV